MQCCFHCTLFIEAATEASPVANRGEADLPLYEIETYGTGNVAVAIL